MVHHLVATATTLSGNAQLIFLLGSQTATVTVEIVDETTDDNVNETTDANTLQTRRNSAYVTHQLHAQKIKLEKCPAYESVVERCRDAT